MDAQDHDARSLVFHQAALARMAAEPALIDRARATFARWNAVDRRRDASRAAWDALLADGDLAAIAAAALSPTEDGAVLRQSSPLPTLLAPAERWTLIRQFREKRGT
jgi:hypothetical protein